MSERKAWSTKNHLGRANVAVHRRRAVFATAALVTCTIAAAGPPAALAAGGEHTDRAGDTKGPLDLAGTSFAQKAREITITVRTHEAVGNADLPGGKSGTLCVTLRWGSPVLPQRRLCVVKTGGGHTAVNVDRLDPRSEKILGRKQRKISTHKGTRFVLRFNPVDLALPVGLVHYGVRSSWRLGSGCRTTCEDTLPASGTFPARVYRAVAAGCAPSSGQVTSGSRNRKVVALTFDDGPSGYTSGYLASLRAEGAVATFFQIGQQVPGQGAIERSILAGGNALGNHSWSHPDLSRGGAFARDQLSRTSAAIRTAAGGYRVCVFRPPYGATSGGLVSVGSGLGMKSILWDVDTNDWKLPGTSAIISRAVGGARPGSIILMHDGGGNRSQTAAAVRPIIRGLKARGYRFVTVPELLGLKTTWRLSRT